MTRKVLLPLDGSSFSRQIIPHICRIFSPEETEVVLFRVAPPPERHTGLPPRTVSAAWPWPMYDTRNDLERAQHPIYINQIEDSVRSTLEYELLPEVRGFADAGYSVSVAIWFGDPAQAIVTIAAAERFDLVAMATHGRTGLRRLVLGSVAERVMRDVSVPVLLVRPFATAEHDA